MTDSRSFLKLEMSGENSGYYDLNPDQIESSFESIHPCRLCLRNGADIWIFDNMSVLSNMSHCNLMVIKNDGLPENICANCLAKLDDAAKFLYQCQENEKILRGTHKYKIEPHNDEDFGVAYYNNSDDNDNDLNYYSSSDCFDSDETDENDKNLMETIVKSENGEEYLHISGIKVFVNRSPIFVDGKINFTNKRKKTNYIPKEGLCPICGKTAIKSLSSHMKLHGERIFSCEICAKAFPIRSKLTQHMIIHSNVRKHKCDHCEKRFKTGSDQRKHINTMHREPLVLYPCTVCNKVFKKQPGLAEHMKVHTQEKSYECSECHRKFAYKVTLTKHMRIHTGERPYTCTYCDRSFAAQQTLKEHVRLHTGEKPYECAVCDKAFIQLTSMKTHFKTNHKGLEFRRKTIVKTNK